MSSSRALFRLAPILLLAFSARAADVSVTLGAGNGFAIKDNTGAVERLRVDEATGNVSRNGALFVHTTGTNNLFVGPGAGSPGTSGLGHNAAFGVNALAANSSGHYNSAFGTDALRYNIAGQNSAFGHAALRSNIGGHYNSAFGRQALRDNTAGVKNSAFGGAALQGNTTGSNNSAFGNYALLGNSTGASNSAFGYGAIQASNSGNNNSAFGIFALRANGTGHNNSAFGGSALRQSSGSSNSAFGYSALRNTSGGNNAAFGNSALANNTTGSSNVAMGIYAGQNQTTGSNNIYLANQGVAAESGQIKIGNTNHTDTFIEGIHGATVNAATDLPVLVDLNNKLGTAASSIRFKEAVRDMGDASEKLRQLRPVVFRYRAQEDQPASGDEYGLIAEEVAAVAPELVAPDADGRPYSVRYHVLPALLLNELQKQQRTIDAQERALVKQRELISALSGRLGRLEAGREGRTSGGEG